MKKIYIKPKIDIIPVATRPVVCASLTPTEQPTIKKYGCPIKEGVDCPDYDKSMNEWAKAIEYMATNKVNQTIYQGSDENMCPHKTCSLYLEWEKQQKTR